MNKLFYSVLTVVLLASSVVFAETTVSKSLTIKGYLVDNACADGNKDKLADFVKGHPKSCMLKGPCSASGYAIYSNGKLEKFTKDSSNQIIAFLNKDDSKTTVEVTAQENKGELALESIKNQ